MIIRSIALRHQKPLNGLNGALFQGMQGQMLIQACGQGMKRVKLTSTSMINSGSTHSRGISSSAQPISSTSSALDSITSLPQTTGGDVTSSYFASIVPYVEQMPTYIGLSVDSPHAYVISIIVATIAMRTAITLPVTIWQRARTRRMTEIVGPKWEQMKRDLPIDVARRCRVQKKTHEEYKVELHKTLKSELRLLLKKNKCAPLSTLLLPLAANIPLFICASLAIRTALITQGSAIGSEIVPWWSPPADLMAKFEEGAKVLQARGLEGEALQKLTQMQGPTLADRDKTMFGPIGLGMLTLINVELGQWLRKPLLEAPTAKATREEDGEDERSIKRKEAREQKASLASLRATVMGNTLRAASIAFVVVASQAPAGLSIYWLSSATYTLVQNSIFAVIDRNRAQAK
ncbi:hypothetical protein L7F22_038797 [Adiantum nelumboides]|nr:hypothetical protein [Adiantum nelumboides]